MRHSIAARSKRCKKKSPKTDSFVSVKRRAFLDIKKMGRGKQLGNLHQKRVQPAAAKPQNILLSHIGKRQGEGEQGRGTLPRRGL